MFTRAVFDYDAFVYAIGHAVEKKSIVVTHKQSGWEKEFDNRTQFWGHFKKKEGGYLGEVNKKKIAKGQEPASWEDFTIVDRQTPKGTLEQALGTVKASINHIVRELQVDEYMGFIGKGASFREDRSTIIKYKGNREDALRPLLKEDIQHYINKHHNGEIVTGLEADDWCVIEGVKEGRIVVASDKDSLGCPVYTYNPDKPHMGIVDGNCYGSLEVTSKNEVRGFGRKWFYFQVAYGDNVDNYRSNSASDLEIGEKGILDMVAHATNDVESLEALVKVYKHIYPEPKEIIGWRGDKIVVDWRYVLSENWDLARMLRHEQDHISAEFVLRKFDLWED